MNSGATFDRVYRALKAELGTGRFCPGDHLEPSALSDELNSSITPVRDALHRLVGEGLVEAPRGDGFRVPLVTEVGLRHLYAWNQWLLLGATRAAGGLVPVDSVEPGVEHLFLAIAGLSANPEHADAIARLNDRLRAIRRVEQSILGPADVELQEVKQALGNMPVLRKLISHYHRRRVRFTAQIVAALYRCQAICRLQRPRP